MNAAPLLISIIIPALNEGRNIGPLIERLGRVTSELGISSEIVVVDGGSTDRTREVAEQAGARCLVQRRPGYASALMEGIEAAQGEYILTLDSDLSHPPELLKELWAARTEADVIIASRFVKGGGSDAPLVRHLLSRILNGVFSIGLSLPVRDSSSGYRLYKREALNLTAYLPQNFNILQEILVRAYTAGFSIKEIPLHYEERASGRSHVSILKFAISYVPTFYRLWKLRNLVSTADYEYRSYHSRHPLQRYWIRKRLALIRGLLGDPQRVLDIGSGSNYLATTLPGLVAVDIEPQKIRFLSRLGVAAQVADAAKLPLSDESFDQIIMSQLLPYVDAADAVIKEAHRVLVPGGKVVVCVPDSHRVAWKVFGTLYAMLPNVKDSRITPKREFTRASLVDTFVAHGFRPLEYQYICGAEVVLLFQKQAMKSEACESSPATDFFAATLRA
jgi:glycosyltransferase involved in cell wall biosynthesis/predicted SAM-dependent methyltransferase